jgi:osmotically-inducible protein OsmY
VRGVDDLLRVRTNPDTEKSDDSIRFKVKSELLFHRSVSETKTDVAVNNGVVTLTGVASSEAEKELAGQYARDVDGVRDVNNELTVSTEPAPRTTGEVIDDASVTAEVKADLLVHHATSAIDTKIITRDGVVTLTGTAKNQAEKDLTTKLASDIRGVKSVVNNMEVKD